MLTRFKFRTNYCLTVRLLSDKPPENDEKLSEVEQKYPQSKETIDAKANTDKIQSLLKIMLEGPKIKPETTFTVAPIIPRKKSQKEEAEAKKQEIEKNITTAVSEVAKAIGGDVKQTEAELLSKVLGQVNQTPTDLSKLLTGMKVNRTKESDSDDNYRPETRGQQVKRLIGKSRDDAERRTPLQRRPQSMMMQRSPMQKTTVNVFSGEPSGIFKKNITFNYGTKLDTWDMLEKRELTLATTQPPANYFQKMILWTEQGKVWKFPINNEQGLEEEDQVHFSEHIFLDVHLEGWCPTKGPIRHFMELVCIGLSKNPFYTSQEKKDHIMWYKEYFESKKDILTEVGAWNFGHNLDNSEQAQTS